MASLPNIDTFCLNWIEPNPNEKINDYSKRMINQIDISKDDVTLVGHSFGGVVAQEIASIRRISQIILISSIKSRREMPYMFKLLRPLFLYKIFSKKISTRTIKFWGKTHGFETKKDMTLFNSMVNNQSNNYLQWALKELSSWQEPSIPNTTKLTQIHGTDDKTFPIKLIDKPNISIQNGSHIFIYKQPEIVSELIIKIVKNVV
jgi:pimeloyl-ACP methyl ester carboxylesterase